MEVQHNDNIISLYDCSSSKKETKIDYNILDYNFAEVVTLSISNDNNLEPSKLLSSPIQIQGLECEAKSFLQFKGVLLKPKLIFTIQFLSQNVNLIVTNIKPFGSKSVNHDDNFLCFIGSTVKLEIPDNEDDFMPTNVSLTEIGGYKEQMKQLEQVLHSLFFDPTSKIKKFDGILISGPSGCGKTFIGETLEKKLKGRCSRPSMNDIKSKYKGVTEYNLQKLFKNSFKKSPSVIFMDDIDYLCEKREEEGHAGAVTTLLHLLDGIDTNLNVGVLVIATSTNPEGFDLALRRPGRLSVDIKLGSLDEQERTEVLSVLMKPLSHSLTHNDMLTLGKSTPGFLGGDLHTLLIESLSISKDTSLSLDHIIQGKNFVEPAALKSSHTMKDIKNDISDICGYNDVICQLTDFFDLALNYREAFESTDSKPPNHFLVFGPSGCGKTFIVSAIAAKFNLSIIPIRRSNVLGKYFGETEKNLARIFSKAKEASPCVLLFENFEGLGGTKRPDSDSTDVESRIINHLKVLFDGIESDDGIIIVAETTRPHLLDKNVIRRGRFHNYFYFKLPSSDDIKKILFKYISTNNLNEDVSIEYIADCCHGFTTTEVIQLCNFINMQLKENLFLENKFYITKYIINEAKENIIPSTSLKLLNKYEVFANIYCPHMV